MGKGSRVSDVLFPLCGLSAGCGVGSCTGRFGCGAGNKGVGMGWLLRRNRALQRQKGLTLIEVLVVVGIIAIMLGISIPYISVQDAKLRSTARSLRSHLMQARLEALVRYTDITFCVYTTGYNATTDNGDVLFRNDFPESVSASSDDITIYFKPLGTASNMNFEIHSINGNSYSISVSAVGNVRVEK